MLLSLQQSRDRTAAGPAQEEEAMNAACKRYLFFITVTVLFSAWGGTAAAQSGGKQTEIYPIVITLQNGYEVQKDLVQKAALTAISENPNYSYQQGHKSFHGTKPSQDPLKTAEDLYNQAFSRYDDLDLPGAVEKAEEALEIIELGAAHVDDLTLAVKILHLIGSCHTLNGDLNAASDAFLRAYAINPTMKPDPNIFPPDIIDVFDAVGQGAGEVGTGSISVKSKPKEASVYLDGMPMGVTPVKIDNVLVGKHIIRLSKPGYQFFGSVLTVEKGKSKSLDTKLQEVPGVSRVVSEIENIPALIPKGMNSTLPSLNTIAKDLGVEQLLVVLMSPGEGQIVSLNILVYDRLKDSYIAQRSGDAASMGEQVLLPKAEELSKATLVAAMAGGEGGEVTDITPPVVGPGTEGEGKKKKDRGIAGKWWFWVALIAGAGVVAGGAYLGYAGSTGQLGSGGPGGSGGSGDIIIEF
jgi:tetratricopeptide (TPR) repeat protein